MRAVRLPRRRSRRSRRGSPVSQWRHRAHGADWHRLARLIGLELALAVGDQALARLSTLVESLLGDRVTTHVSVCLMQHAATLDLAQFEDPQFYNLLERARQNSTPRVNLLGQLIAIGQYAVTVASLSAAVLLVKPWLLVLLMAAFLPSLLGETHYSRRAYSLFLGRTEERRMLEYLRYVGASDATAKEVQMFALAPWLIDRFRTLSERFYVENRALAVRRTLVSCALPALGILAYYGAYVGIVSDAVRGAITVGTLSFLAASFGQSRNLLQIMLQSTRDIYEQALYLRDLFEFLALRPTITSRRLACVVPRPIRDGFVFENVGFRYARSERWALRHITLTLHAGERIALVGENGTGKTTLTKLLSRLYDPTEGRILLDGVDLRDYDLTQLRRAIGVIFQDFVRYDFRFDENIGVGEIERTRAHLDNTLGGAVRLSARDGAVFRPIAVAAEQSRAASLLPRLPNRYTQVLGRRFAGGVDLSGGEWQKVALARAYLRRAQLLILDEPTAALDARAEYEVFERFAELMTGRTAVLISHRFSTVRMADRIIVLAAGADGGTVVEQGTHDELLRGGGLYAELFTMQAAGYR